MQKNLLNNKKNLKKCLQNQNKKVYTEKKDCKKGGVNGKN